MYGITGKVLRVNLIEDKIKVQKFEEDFYKKFLGGAGLGAKVLFDELTSEIDPLSPANRLIFSVGPFQGTVVPGSSKVNVSARSPLTGIWGESSAGGGFGLKLKLAGFDAIVIQGKAEKPVYLWVHDREVEIKDASRF